MSHLVIRLGEIAVGDLRHRSGDSWEFRFRADYVSLRPRPVLGQSFEDDLERIHRENLRLPPFFSNLLPEGPLRRLVAREAAVNEQREALLLEFLGGDLPGAVVIEKGDDLGEEGENEPPVSPAEEAAESKAHLKFSLAGVQLKFSVLRSGDRLTLPATGLGGNWIVKLPDAQYPGVPANELSMLRWARLAGIEVPDHELVPISEIGGLPHGLRFAEREALAVRRFDRSAGGRIHQEDFAQVLELFPAQKYEKYNYETIANVIHAVAGPEALLEYARRLAFVVLSGNGDAHHKNWSLLYLDGRRASLAPAYDLVFTRAYLERDNLALNLRRSKRFRDVTLESFRHLAQKTGFDESRLTEAVAEVVQQIRKAWAMYEPEMPMAKDDKASLRRHLDSIRL
ncbi:MAG TPA: type II toxin-antitoxin system HipA family toxin [Thermoanaerobaculia bacterium]|jgi:serine/threonine-protein kinase HipA|nr:type II toxin-antitoxin system HipA family toxin [Thermoanaerobaculia bacterium]